jgi:signal transduction histidine kinase
MQQATMTQVLRENVSSRRSAADLRGTLNTLIALETNQVEAVADLHLKATTQIATIKSYANLTAEQAILERLEHGYQRYLEQWQNLPPHSDPAHHEQVQKATQFLEVNVLSHCREIEAFNDQQVEETTAQHERILKQLAWGMAVVAGLGAIAGIVFGYGVARIVSQSIRRLQIQIRAVAGQLGPNESEVVVTGDTGFGRLHDELELLRLRIEAVVHELHDREREVAKSERLAATGQLAAGIGHELRNPLTSVKLLVQTGLADSGGLPRDDLVIIEAEIRRMERTLQTFLDFARPPLLARRPVAVEPLLATVLSLIRGRAEQQRVTLHVTHATPHCQLIADSEQLRQVFVNLLLNALDVLPKGGKIAISTGVVGQWYELDFADSGPGIAPDMRPRLFEPFASNKDTGLGLGLVISRRIVDDHGGTLTVTDGPLGGAMFTIRLPIDIGAK